MQNRTLRTYRVWIELADRPRLILVRVQARTLRGALRYVCREFGVAEVVAAFRGRRRIH